VGSSHLTYMRPSLEQLAIMAPSLLKSTPVTASECAAIVRWHVPRCRSHKRIVSSNPPLTSRVLSGWHATHMIYDVCPRNVRTTRPWMSAWRRCTYRACVPQANNPIIRCACHIRIVAGPANIVHACLVTFERLHQAARSGVPYLHQAIRAARRKPRTITRKLNASYAASMAI